MTRLAEQMRDEARSLNERAAGFRIAGDRERALAHARAAAKLVEAALALADLTTARPKVSTIAHTHPRMSPDASWPLRGADGAPFYRRRSVA